MTKNYWGYRIDTTNIPYFRDELIKGRLHQGWGYDEGQDLRKLTFDEGASGNLSMFNNVKKGDILLVPRLPDWNHVSIVEATADFKEGYEFKIDDAVGDYGHSFPAKILTQFVRSALPVSGNIQSTLRTPMRFWNINHYAKDIEEILETPLSDLDKFQGYTERFDSAVYSSFYKFYQEKEFSDKIYETMNHQFSDTAWEYALTYGLSKLFPAYTVERTGGVPEFEHGTDILIRIPGLSSETNYGIAIQVKDYEGISDSSPIEQICKADAYWWEHEQLKIIEKYVIFTKLTKEENIHLLDDKRVKLIFGEQLKELLSKISKVILGLKDE
jgi:hypothetical protein